MAELTQQVWSESEGRYVDDAPAPEPPPILRAQYWRTNGHMIADVARLGYLKDDDTVLDPTFGRGTWWLQWQPIHLYGHTPDFVNILTPTELLAYDCAWDFTQMFYQEETFDAVAFDPPYKLNGTPSGPDERYGVSVPATVRERMGLIHKGLDECVRVVKPGGIVLVKCGDQVVSGSVYWQTDVITGHMANMGVDKIDRFDFLHHPRPQPPGRTQVHARSNYSTLLVFRTGPA